MASSDKNAARSIASGNPTQPTQPISKAESSEVAGQLLNSLKASDSKRAASHEARLGIMVITILVFAFGFLVYHKMDMHQRQLTKAAIAPNVVPPQEPPDLDQSATSVTSSLAPATMDPLVNIGDLSDGSPFTEPVLSLDEPPSDRLDDSSAFAIQDESATASSLPKRSAEPSSASEFLLNEPPSAEVASSVEGPQPTFDPGMTEDSAIPEPQPDFVVAESTPPTIPEIMELDRDTTTAIADLPTDTATDNKSMPDDEPTIAFHLANDEPALEQSTPTDFNAIDFGPESVVEPEQTHSEDQQDQLTFSSGDSKPSEPVLLAMNEPQQQNGLEAGFDNGFLAAEENVPPKGPLNDSSEFPTFDPEPPVLSQPDVAQRHKSQGNSTGFNAVTNPGRHSDRNSIRTAAGSGADGKFSLAAFNYGNRVAPAAPDDGSTFNSVVVQNGDNYTKISKRVYGTVQYFSALAVFNQHRIPEPKNMRPGMVVLVPDKQVLEERYPELFVDSQPKIVQQAGFLLLDDGSPAYRVGERETISEISLRFLGRSSRWIEIYRLNQSTLGDPNKLKPGTILALPADAVEVNVVP